MAKNTESSVVEHQARLRDSVAADLRRLRLTHGQTLEQISRTLGHEKNWLSKIERNDNRLYMDDYLVIMNMLRDIEPDHPGVKLVGHFTRGSDARALRRLGVGGADGESGRGRRHRDAAGVR